MTLIIKVLSNPPQLELMNILSLITIVQFRSPSKPWLCSWKSDRELCVTLTFPKKFGFPESSERCERVLNKNYLHLVLQKLIQNADLIKMKNWFLTYFLKCQDSNKRYETIFLFFLIHLNKLLLQELCYGP